MVALQVAAAGDSIIDVLDRVLDKGIVIDAWLRVSLAGLDLVEIQGRVVVASIDTYLTQASALADAGLVSPPALPTFWRTETRRPRRPIPRSA
ncbi:MAG TPA: gas vesicle protein GvpJ [Terriglobales bacterium]|nr:gas vesicle protein GvpJ [Terriglobales bacterium]